MQADARTAYFGKGSKASAFYFGTSVGVHTCDGSKGDPKHAVLMMTIDGEKMEERIAIVSVEPFTGGKQLVSCIPRHYLACRSLPPPPVPQERTKAGKDAWIQELERRAKTGEDRKKAFGKQKDMRSWEPFMELLERADKCETYSLFIIQGIRQLRRQEMLLENVPAMASELRDMFMVYCSSV